MVYVWSLCGYLLYKRLSLLENRSKTLPGFLSKQETLQSAILFILETATAIIT